MIRVLTFLLLAASAASAAVCKGEDPCRACRDCSQCRRCDPKSPKAGSCGVCRDQDAKASAARQRKRAGLFLHISRR